MMMNQVEGSSRVEGSISYVAQQAWIQNMTVGPLIIIIVININHLHQVRDNILFGSEYNAEKYKTVVEACALAADLKILPAGDQTEIGENGVTISLGKNLIPMFALG